MENFKLVSRGVDVSAMARELAAHATLWTYNTKRQRSLAQHRETEAIFIRNGVATKDLALEDTHETQEAHAAQFLPSTLAFLHASALAIGGELGRALFAKLQPGGQVYRHLDNGAYYAIRNRYHLVIDSAAGSPMVCGNERVVMRKGELWEFNNKEYHEAFNASSLPRIHLIFDLRPAAKN